MTQTARRTKAQTLDEPTPAPIAAPEDPIKRVIHGMCVNNPSKAVREEFRGMLEKVPDLAGLYGNLPHSALMMILGRFKSIPIMEESIKVRLDELRKQIAGPSPSPLESLLVEAVVLSYLDYFAFAMIYGQKTDESINLPEMEQWQRALASKEGCYLRAIEALARVRRLLKLPPVQVNIAGDLRVTA